MPWIVLSFVSKSIESISLFLPRGALCCAFVAAHFWFLPITMISVCLLLVLFVNVYGAMYSKSDAVVSLTPSSFTSNVLVCFFCGFYRINP